MTPRTGKQIIKHMKKKGSLSVTSGFINKQGRKALEKEVAEGRVKIENLTTGAISRKTPHYVPIKRE